MTVFFYGSCTIALFGLKIIMVPAPFYHCPVKLENDYGSCPFFLLPCLACKELWFLHLLTAALFSLKMIMVPAPFYTTALFSLQRIMVPAPFLCCPV